jgi:uncharacterized membrane protein YvbJ
MVCKNCGRNTNNIFCESCGSVVDSKNMNSAKSKELMAKYESEESFKLRVLRISCPR